MNSADQNSTEVWDSSGGNPVLLDGGKHYGHLEVNLKKIQEGNKTFAQIDFEPVYSFPVFNAQYQLQIVERRVYDDPVRILVELNTILNSISPQFKNSIQVELNQEGKIETKLSDYLVNPVEPDWVVTYSRSPVFTCEDLGEKEITVTVKNAQNQEWSSKVTVKVLDKIAPDFEASDAFLAFDKVEGKVTLDADSFYIRQEFITENSLSNGSINIEFDRRELTCADLTGEPILIRITLTDRSGNATTKIRRVTLNPIESKKISISPAGNFLGKSGETMELSLGEEFAYSVEAWLKDRQVITGQKDKKLVVNQSGTYWANVIPAGGCAVETLRVEVSLLDKPYGPLKSGLELDLNSLGRATLGPAQIFETWPLSDPNLIISLSQSEFDCADIGEKEVTLTIKNQTGQSWTEKVMVKIQDKESPILALKNLTLDFDLVKGSLVIKPEDFIASLTDNCLIKEVTISKTTVGCEDVGKETPIVIRAWDGNGNMSEATTSLTLRSFEAQKVALTGTNQFCQGDKSSLVLSSSSPFEVVRWLKNGIEIPGQTAKTLDVTESGSYRAVIRYAGACLSESSQIQVEVFPLPVGEIEVNGNILRAPEGNFSYQWFRNGELISGATSRTLTVDSMGEYGVELKSVSNCISRLKPVTLTISGLGGTWNPKLENIKIYPNPSSSRVFLEIPEDGILTANSIQVFSLEGKDVTEMIQKIQISERKVELGISSLSSGTYLIWIPQSFQKTYLGKFILLK